MLIVWLAGCSGATHRAAQVPPPAKTPQPRAAVTLNGLPLAPSGTSPQMLALVRPDVDVLIEQVVLNLLDNAVKYGDGPIEAAVITEEARPATAPAVAESAPATDGAAGAGRLRLTILDHGAGVPEADRERLFTRFERGDYDVILATEDKPGPTAEVLTECDLLWIGAAGGVAWQHRPLRLAIEEHCIFRPLALAALDRAGIAWEMASSGRNCEVMAATAAADLGVTARLRWAVPEGCAVIEGANALPALGRIRIAMYCRSGAGPVAEALAAQLRCTYGETSAAVAAQ